MTLTQRSFSAASWTTLSTLARAGLQLAQVAVLARFLHPRDYGLMAMVSVVLSYAALFGDMGLSSAFVQRPRISDEERSSLYWLSVSVGGALMVMVVAVSPFLASFFNEPQLVPLMTLAATNLLVVALGQQLRMYAEKALNFRPLATIEIAAAFIGFAVAVFSAWLGYGVYSLVASSMMSAWLTMLLSWTLLSNGWRPVWRLRWRDVRWFARFGGGMVVNNVINHVNSTVDLLLGGRMLGAAQIGVYGVSRNLILQVQFIVNPVFTRVGFPLIASIQDDKERVRLVYLKTMNMTASVNAPIYFALGLFAPEIVFLLLGESWEDASPLLRVLAIWGLLRSFGNPVGSLLFGLGRVRLATCWNAGLLFIIPPFVWLGSHWGPIGMAWTMTGLTAALFIPGWAILVRPTCGAGLWEYTKQVVLPAFCAGGASAVGWFAAGVFEGNLSRLAIGVSFGFFGYIAFSLLLNKEWCLVLARAIRSMAGAGIVRS